MSMRVDYEKHIEKELATWNARLAAVRISSDDRARAEYDEALAQWKGAHAKLNELKAAPSSTWGAIKADVKRACQTVADALAGLTAREPRPDESETIPDAIDSTRITEPWNALGVPPEPTEAA